MNSGASFHVANCNQDLNHDPEETNFGSSVQMKESNNLADMTESTLEHHIMGSLESMNKAY